jgi:hypothetical protein
VGLLKFWARPDISIVVRLRALEGHRSDSDTCTRPKIVVSGQCIIALRYEFIDLMTPLRYIYTASRLNLLYFNNLDINIYFSLHPFQSNDAGPFVFLLDMVLSEGLIDIRGF